jgi:hypothetical protein
MPDAEEGNVMEGRQFDNLLRSLAQSRRSLLGGALGIGALTLPSLVDAKKHKKRKKKKVKFNDFGCVNVGGFCKNGGQCCSGICAGKKGKKKCQAHGAGGCGAADDFCATGQAVPCTTDANLPGQCVHTTGNAGFCEVAGECFPCTRDPDCVAACGIGAACIVCESECGVGGTACVGAGPDPCVI